MDRSRVCTRSGPCNNTPPQSDRRRAGAPSLRRSVAKRTDAPRRETKMTAHIFNPFISTCGHDILSSCGEPAHCTTENTRPLAPRAGGGVAGCSISIALHLQHTHECAHTYTHIERKRRRDEKLKMSGFVNLNELQSRSTSSPPTLPQGTGIAILN